MYRMFTSREQQRESNDRYAEQIATQLTQMVCDSSTNILSQNGDHTSEMNMREAIRFVESVRDDLVKDLNQSVENMHVRFFNTKGGENK